MNTFLKNKGGFLLIEIIVVVAIIAILFAIFYGKNNGNNEESQNIVQNKLSGEDAAIKESMNVLAINSAIFYSSQGSYNGFCDDPSTKNVYNSIILENKYCSQNNTGWAFCARLIEDNSKAWCVDNAGVKKEIDASLCKNGLFACP